MDNTEKITNHLDVKKVVNEHLTVRKVTKYNVLQRLQTLKEHTTM